MDEDGQDVATDLPTIGREHYPSDKTRPIGGEDGVTDCSDSPRVCEKYGLDRSASNFAFCNIYLGCDISTNYMEEVCYFSKENIKELPWPDTQDAIYAKKFLLPLIESGPEIYIENVQTSLALLLIDQHLIPITFNDAQYSNSYICSPCAQYVGFGNELFGKKNLLLHTCFSALENLLRWAKLNRVVMVNNWLFSTNLYPDLTFKQIQAISSFLREKFRSYTILFRSLNPMYDSSLISALSQLKFSISANRMTYITENSDTKAFRTRMFKSDLKVLKNSPYQVLDNEEIENHHLHRIVELYRYLYIEKYSKLNPMFNAKFVEHALRSSALHFKALYKDGSIDAIMGFFVRRGIITSPFFGYDTSLPKDLGLYRQISILLSLEAQKRNLTLNHSSGAASYKKLRGAKPVMEYIAIDAKNTLFRQKTVWWMIKNTMNLFGKTIMKKADL